MKKGKKITVSIAIMFAVLAVYSLSLLFMYLWGLSTSLKTVDGFKKDMIWLPEGFPWEWEWENYALAFENFQSGDMLGADSFPYRVGFVGMFINTIIYSSVPPLITLCCTFAMAYVCAIFHRMKASKIIYSLNMILMMIPIVGTMQSSLQIYKALNLYDTWGWAFVSSISFVGTNFLIFYSYLRAIGPETREAALIDGAGNFTIMLKIILPLCANMFMILFISSFIANWNDYMTMILWLPSKPSLAYGMYRFQFLTGQNLSWPTVQVAACVILMLPVLALFIAFKDAILGGITIGLSK